MCLFVISHEILEISFHEAKMKMSQAVATPLHRTVYKSMPHTSSTGELTELPK